MGSRTDYRLAGYLNELRTLGQPGYRYDGTGALRAFTAICSLANLTNDVKRSVHIQHIKRFFDDVLKCVAS